MSTETAAPAVARTAPAARSRPRVLLLAPFPPGSSHAHGGALATGQLITALADRARIALAYLRATDEGPADAAVTTCCESVLEVRRPGDSRSSIRPFRRLPLVLGRVAAGTPLWAASRWSATFAKRVRAVSDAWRPQIVHAEFAAMGMYLSAARTGGSPTVVRFHDPGTSASRERIVRSRAAALAWKVDAMLGQRFERRILDSVDAAVALTERDARVLAALGDGKPIATIPVGITAPARAADPAGGDPPLLLFVGNFNHPPNVDAAFHLADDVFPPLRRRYPALELALVGPHPPQALMARAGPGLRVTGYVSDLAGLMDAASVVVAPVRQGGGMRVKVLEALAAGKATVGTELAFEGTGIEPGRHALVAEGAEALCEAVASLLERPDRRAALGRAAREHVLSSLSCEGVADRFGQLYRDLLSTRADS